MTNSTQETSSSEIKVLTLGEQQALIKEENQRFIKLAKEKGFITIEEINELLPPEILDASVLDSFMQALEVNGVVITDLSQKKDTDDESGSFLGDPDKEEDESDDDEKPKYQGSAEHRTTIDDEFFFDPTGPNDRRRGLVVPVC